MVTLLVLIACFLTAYFLVHHMSRLDSQKRSRAWLWIGIGFVVGMIILFIIARRYELAIAGVPLLFPIFAKLPNFSSSSSPSSSKSFSPSSSKSSSNKRKRHSHQTSKIETRFLRMKMMHDTGVVTGFVKSGRYKGRTLETLSREEYRVLLQECYKYDIQSVQLLEAWLDHTFGPNWRQDKHAHSSDTSESTMSEEYAYRVLGLSPGASEREIKEAYQRLMKLNHPDQGGSTKIAAKINQARDFLLKKGKI